MAENSGHIELERTIDSIVVGIRHRQNPRDGIEPLMASIKKLGLLQPITITPDGVLVCGARRLEAAKRLGWRTLKVWVRSGISDDLSRLLAQRDENVQRKPLNALEKAALFRELYDLIREDAARRKQATQFGAKGESDETDGPGESPGPEPGHGDARHQAALAVTGRASYQLLERISTIERIAADRTLPDTVREIADLELKGIKDGAAVDPAYRRVLSAKRLIAADDAPEANRPLTSAEVEAMSDEAVTQFEQNKNRRGGHGAQASAPSYRSLRAFLLTWGDLDGWSRFFNPSEIAAQLKPNDWEMFERVLAETITFADEVRTLRNVRVSA